MKAIYQLEKTLQRLGLQIAIVDGDVVLRGKTSRATPQLVDICKELKPAILEKYRLENKTPAVVVEQVKVCPNCGVTIV